MRERTEPNKLVEVHPARPVLVLIPHDLQDFCLFQVKAQCAHRYFELVVVYSAILVGVEQLKGFFDLTYRSA